MASALETLIPELLDLIVENLGNNHAAINRMTQCSKSLYNRLRPVLYGSPASLERAMRSACRTGNVQTIQVAISYGAEVSTIGSYYRSSTLKLAAEKGHVEAFDLLVKLGASFDHPNVTHSPRLSRQLCSPVKEAVLFSFLKAGFASLPGIELSLCSIIRTGGSPDLVRAFLDHGIDINRHERTNQYHIIATALSTAIMENRMSIFDVLIQRGANIHGTEMCNPFNKQVPYPFREPLHLPIYAAAVSMAKHGSTLMMQRCIDLGADINYRSLIQAYSYVAVCTTPLLMYISSIENWGPNAEFCPIDGLKFLLQQNAALELQNDSAHRRINNHDVGTVSSIELLLDKWGIKKLRNPEFCAVIEFLIEKGAGKHSYKKILTKYGDGEGKDSEGDDPAHHVVTNWTWFANLLIKRHTNTSDPTAKNLLLRTIFLRDRRYQLFGEIDRCTVRCLIKAGADINAHTGHDSPTILHEVCDYRNLSMFMFSHICGHEDIFACGFARLMFSYFSFLHDLGADPRIVVRGKSPIDVLLEPTQKSFRLSANGEKYLVRLGNILLGKLDTYSLSHLKSLDMSKV
ncbi:hypothetical protein BKA65DRAFT_500495 [Rhexocercosporidium sp. MPI-PUGE-AT-0058]|nr:hypothetical protein BKA65DRAFT_500495 [Rhexocercosporidium sp. MPI-PUGE-AT-0058]